MPGEVRFRIRNEKNGAEKPLIFIDGVEQIREGALEKINPNTIESISVLKDESAKSLYGEKGKNGVILITTENASAKKAVK